MSENSRKSESPLITLDGVAKSYGSVQVLKSATFSIARGEVVALMGENGAGKSTLKNILCGLVAPDSGTITVETESYSKLTPLDVRQLGFGAIHQELSLFPNLSVAENIQIGVSSLPTTAGVVSRSRLLESAKRTLDEIAPNSIDIEEVVGRLSLGERQLVEVAKALHRASSLLIFDEPTTSLSLPERERLFKVVRKLKARGFAIVYITHFMEEVFALADRIVVLRDGSIVGTGTPQTLTADELAKLMVGRELSSVDALSGHTPPITEGKPSDVVLKARNLEDGGLLRDVSFDLRRGEILGVAGLMGAGRTEVAHALFGISNARGSVELCGEPFDKRDPNAALRRGLALVSEDRRTDQIFPGRTVFENITSTSLKSFKSSLGLLSRTRRKSEAKSLMETYGVRNSAFDVAISALSGGNQQKCVIARWLSTKPSVCILDEPTKGIDVSAKADVHLLVNQLAANGLGVLLISSDLPELLALSHRLLVMHKGKVAGFVERADFDASSVMRLASVGEAA